MDDVNVRNFIADPNMQCIQLTMKRYIRMRNYFLTKRLTADRIGKKNRLEKKSAIRKQLKSLNRQK